MLSSTRPGTLSIAGTLLLAFAQASQSQARSAVAPTLEFPQPGLDDTATYRGYRTRFFRDANGNTVQIYVDHRQARVVHLFANAENESIGFSALDSRDSAASLQWGSPGAGTWRSGGGHGLQYALSTASPVVRLGHFLLGSMRVERDFQAWGHHREPFAAPRWTLAEHAQLLEALESLPAALRRVHLAQANAPSTIVLRARLHPSMALRRGKETALVRVTQPSLDGRDTMALEILADSREVAMDTSRGAVELRSREGGPVAFDVRILTTGKALQPLRRTEIFSDEFLRFAAASGDRDPGSVRHRWLERQIRGVEHLASRDKLMAGLPTYATYFGRDMMVSVLAMEPIWRPEMLEFVIGSVLKKLSPRGDVSHEEALGGQAVREAAAEYASLVRAAVATHGRVRDSLLTAAGSVLRQQRRTRENYHMIDDDLQLPVVASRWLRNDRVSADRKRQFLTEEVDGAPRLAHLLRVLALVARSTDAYARDPRPGNLISFAPRDSGRWASTSWRDSNAGYANGRYAMDVNAIWAPHALASIREIFRALRELGLSPSAGSGPGSIAPDTPLGRYLANPTALDSAIETWSRADEHFLIQLSPAALRKHVDARLAAMPAAEAAHWREVIGRTGAARDSLTFLAIALDAGARPIGVMNTDAATRLFLGRPGATGGLGPDEAREARRDVHTFVRAYPVGLLINGVGPVVANDAYATPAVWEAFARDPYHGPRVVWGREVNLFLLGVAQHIEAARRSPELAGREPLIEELRTAAARVQREAEASGFQSELWSYDFTAGVPVPVRYGSGADVQLWSTTDLVVQYVLWQMQD